MKLVRRAVLAVLVWGLDGPFEAAAVPDGFDDEFLFQESRPTDLTFTPQGQMLVAQKEGILNVFDSPDGDYSYSEKTVALDISDITCEKTELGLVGVQVHPNFESNRYVYLYYSYDKNDDCLDGPVNRLSRFVLLETNIVDKDSENIIFETQPLEKPIHTGGRIQFGKDGYLYVSVGDGGGSDLAQSAQSLLGSIIRLTDEGDIPPDNPYVQETTSVRCNEKGVPPSGSDDDAKCQELFAIGLRNPWGLVMNPNTEGNKVHFYINDVGAENWEEINEGGDDFVGANYGWPVREGPCPRGETSDCEDDEGGVFNHPIHYYVHLDQENTRNAGAVTAGAFVPPGIWPSEYDGEYLYADYVFGNIYVMKDSGEEECLECNPPESNKDISVFHSFEDIAFMRFGPYMSTMALYYTSIEKGGVVHRIIYGEGNSFPDAVIDVTATAVEVGAAVGFSGASSSDPDGEALSFEWDFDGDGTIDSTLAEDSFIYDTTGLFDAQLTVRDENGGTGTASLKIHVLPDTFDPSEVTAFELFPWRSGIDCPEGYDFCGVLEFCMGKDDDKIYGYRLLCLEEECECLGTSAPLIRLVPGNKYRLTLRNDASEVTNLHTHGLHIVGDGDSDDIIRQVSGGGNCLDYTWDIAADHPGGTYWYHAHHHGLAEKQVGGGAYGLLIVEDNKELNPTLPPWAENELLLQVAVTPTGLLGNGKPNEIIYIAADQWYRLRVSIVSTDAVPSNFTFADQGSCEVHRIAADGIWRSVVPGPKADTFVITGASRADFAIRCNEPDSLVPIYYMNDFAATIRVGPSEPSSYEMEAWYPVRPYALQDLSIMTVPEGNTFTVGLGFETVNDVKWDPDQALATIGYNQVHEWTLVGTEIHPFHIHLYHMQITTPGGCGAHEEGEFYDSISAPGDCTIRFMTADFGQRCVLHCHVLFHEDNGSMAWVNVTGPDMPRNDVQSMEYSCPKNSLTSHPTVAPAPTPAPTLDEADGAPATSSSAAVVSKWLSMLTLVLVNLCLV